MTTSSNDNVEGLKGNCKKVRNKKSKIKYEKQKATYFGENFAMNQIRVFSHQQSAFSFGIKCFIWQNKIVKIAYIFIFLILCFALCFDSNYASSS